MNILRKIASKLLPDAVEKVLFSPETKKAVEYAGRVVENAKEFQAEVDAVAVAVKALTKKIKEKAKASEAEWDDKPAEMLDNFIDKTIELLKDVKMM